MRYLEIDLIRGIAVTLMIICHFLFDVFYFNPILDSYGLIPAVPSIFILVSGISLYISYSKGGNFAKFSRRGVKLFFLGMVITAMGFLFLSRGFILFGILHFFGLSSFLVYPFLKYVKNRMLYLLIGISIIALGIYLLNLTFETSYFLWLGLMPKNFSAFDYFPILPWFGVLLVGIFLGKFFYPSGKRKFKIHIHQGKILNLFSFLGKNSLIIYFIHQPILFLILFLLGQTQFLSVFSL